MKTVDVPISTPMYFFISDGKEVGIDNWRELLSSYTEKLNYGKYKYLDCGHYLHNIETDLIVEESKNFIEEISELNLE